MFPFIFRTLDPFPWIFGGFLERFGSLERMEMEGSTTEPGTCKFQRPQQVPWTIFRVSAAPWLWLARLYAGRHGLGASVLLKAVPHSSHSMLGASASDAPLDMRFFFPVKAMQGTRRSVLGFWLMWRVVRAHLSFVGIPPFYPLGIVHPSRLTIHLIYHAYRGQMNFGAFRHRGWVSRHL